MVESDTSSQSSKSLRPAQTSRRYYAFLVAYLVILSAVGSFVNDMYTPSLPSITRYFHCTVSLAQLSLTFGMIGLAIGQLVMGPVSDRYGRKPVLYASVSVLILGSVLIIFSPNIHTFNFFRLVMGLGAAGGYFLARTIPADIFKGRDLAKIMALIGAINGIAPASAPILGGVIADSFSWKGVFVSLIGFAVIVCLLAAGLKESLYKEQRSHIAWWRDFPGYMTLIRNRSFISYTLLKGAALGILFSYISSASFILEEHYGFSQTVYGLVIGANSVFVAIGSMAALKFHPFKKAAIVGACILAPMMTAQAYCLWHVHNFWLYEVFTVIMLFSLGMIFSVSNTLAMDKGRDRAGEASALLGTSGYIFGGVCVPLCGIGDVFHSTAIVYMSLTVIVLLMTLITGRLKTTL